MAYIGRFDWELARTAVAVTASAEVSAYGATQLITAGARPAKLSTTTGNWVLEFDGAIAPAFAMLAYHYLDAGLSNVKIQANTTDSWGSPAFEATFTIPAKRLDGPSYQRWTKNPMIELEGLDPGGYEFWRLNFGTANSQNIIVGQLLLYSQLLEFDLLHVDGSPFDRGDETTEISKKTELDVESGIYKLGGPRRLFSAYAVGTDLNAGTAPVQQASDFQNHHEASEGRAYPFAFLPFGSASFSDVWYVRPEANNLPRADRQGGYQVFPFAVREISRGLPFP
jgi:hypothetical protein